jgi:hypothetical protein
MLNFTFLNSRYELDEYKQGKKDKFKMNTPTMNTKCRNNVNFPFLSTPEIIDLEEDELIEKQHEFRKLQSASLTTTKINDSQNERSNLKQNQTECDYR